MPATALATLPMQSSTCDCFHKAQSQWELGFHSFTSNSSVLSSARLKHQMCPPEGSVWGQETSSTTCKILKSLGLAPPRKRGVECPPYSVLRGKWKEGWKKSPCPSAALGWLAALPAAALRAGRGTRRAEESGVESASHSKVWAA